MTNVIRNDWRRDGAVERAAILSRDTSPEGLDVERLRFASAAELSLDPGSAHVVGVMRGRAVFDAASTGPLAIGPGSHLFVPIGAAATLRAEAGFEAAHVWGPRARGTRVLLRDEAFVRACAHGDQSLRWVLTPQYLSRRIFLHHDPGLVSARDNPVSWFHTTMFDVVGLPPNDDGEPVFKMAYTSRTEFNVCYDVSGSARVRLAPLAAAGGWADWAAVDGETTYHLNEVPEADGRTRNKHEVSALGGHVTLFCAFDPAPTGIERHRPGEYSDYEPYDVVAARAEFHEHKQRIGPFDEMVDTLSLAKARGELDALEGQPVWRRYLEGRDAQRRIEAALIASTSPERARVIASWATGD